MTTYRSVSSGAFTGTTGATGVATSHPIGAAAGDVLYLGISFSANSTVVGTVAASGWDVITTNAIAGPSNSAVVLRRVMQGGDSAPTVNWAAGGTSSGAWMMMAFDEADEVTPNGGVAPVETTGAATTAHAAGSINPANIDDMLVCMAFGDNPGAGIVGDYTAAPPGMTLVDATAGTNAGFVGAAYQQLSSTSATGTKTFTNTSAAYAAVSFVIKNAVTVKTASDSWTLGDTGAIARTSTGTDAFTLTDTASVNQQRTAVDAFGWSEVVTETLVADNTDESVLTESPAVTSAAVGATDVAELKELLQDSPGTGVEATNQGTPIAENYFIALDAAGALFSVGNKFLLFTTGGSLKEPTVFTVSSVSEPSFGYRNVFFSPNALDTPDSGDVARVIHGPTGAQITSDFPITDAFLASDAGTLSRASSGSDAFTFSDNASLFTGTNNAATDSASLVDAAALTQGYVATDSGALSEGASTALGAVGGTDTATGADSAAVAGATGGSDGVSLGESVALARGSAVSDGLTLGEAAPSATATVGASENFALTDTAALVTSAEKAGTDSATQNDPTPTISALPSVTDTAATADSASISAAVSVSDTATGPDNSTLGSGDNNSVTDSAILSDVAAGSNSAPASDAATLADSASLTVNLSVSDSQIQDEQGTTWDLAFAVAEVFEFADSASLFTGSANSASDEMTLSEIATILGFEEFDGSDSFAFSDAVAHTAAPTGSDSAAVVESSAISVMTAVSDSQSLADAADSPADLVPKFGTDAWMMTETGLVNRVDADTHGFARFDIGWPDLNPEVGIYLES